MMTFENFRIRGSLRILAIGMAGLLMLVPAGCRKAQESTQGVKEKTEQVWTCPMHPSIRSPKPGQCPICGMDLVLAEPAPPSAATRKKQESKTEVWTCPMHPSVRSPKPGSCPICGMDLVPADPAKPDTKTAEGLEPMREMKQIFIPPARQQAFGVTYGEAQVLPLARSINAPLRLEPDPAGLTEVSIKAGGGFIVSMDVGFPGQEVKKGDRLLTVLSEGWIEAQQSYIQAFRESRRYALENKTANLSAVQSMLNRTRQRIRLWDLNEDQIRDLEKIATESTEWDVNLARKIRNNLELRSPIDGYVLEKSAVVGMRFESGQRLLLLAPRRPLWGTAALSPEDAARIRQGDVMKVTIDTLPGVDFQFPVDHIDPATDPETRRVNVHLRIENPLPQLRPGQTGAASTELPAVSVLSVPASALLPLGRDHVVFVDRGDGHLEPRRVRAGERFGDRVEIREGLKEGERVATSANFLLDSEARLKGAMPTDKETKP